MAPTHQGRRRARSRRSAALARDQARRRVVSIADRETLGPLLQVPLSMKAEHCTRGVFLATPTDDMPAPQQPHGKRPDNGRSGRANLAALLLNTLHRLKGCLVDNPQMWDVSYSVCRGRIRSREALARLRILNHPDLVPNDSAGIESAMAARGVAVHGRGIPSGAAGCLYSHGH